MTSVANKRAIEQEGPLPSAISFSYFGTDRPLHRNMALARSQNWYRFARWMKQSLKHAEDLHNSHPFDVAHHLTLGTVRVASPLWKLPIPFVLGPCGGGELIPLKCFGALRPREAMWESTRYINTALLPFSAAVRDSVKNAAITIGSTRLTCGLLRRLGAQPGKIAFLPSVCINTFEMNSILKAGKLTDPQGPLRVATGGVLDGRKGINLAILAVALAKNRGAHIQFTITCHGPEHDHLRRLSLSLGLGETVFFRPGLSRDDYLRELARTDLFLFPSLRDNCPATLIEAMLSGCVPVVVDCNGPGEIVDDTCGFKVPPSTPTEIVQECADVMCDLYQHREKMLPRIYHAKLRAKSCFSEVRFAAELNRIHRAAIAEGPSRRTAIFR
jgi:glycosyltransferase involved in cell wall biosynthesis